MNQGAQVVLLTRENAYLELASKKGDQAELIGPSGAHVQGSIAKLQAAGFVAKQALKIVKLDKSCAYMVPGEKASEVYAYGRYHPEILRRAG